MVSNFTSDLFHYYLTDKVGKTNVRITPSKGGMITGFSLNGSEYLYIDEDNLLSDDRPRCAMPLLFPVCGKIDNNTLIIDGKSYNMGIHGIAHIYPWKVISFDNEGNELIIELKSNSETKKSYPYVFSVRITYRLEGTTLAVLQEYMNHSDKAMPFNYGFHPYFKMTNLKNIKFENFNLLDGSQMKNEKLVMPEGSPSTLILHDVNSPVSFIDVETGKGAIIDFDKSYKNIVLWSIPEKSFICIEPWNGLINEINLENGQKLRAGEVLTAKMSITLKDFMSELFI